MRTIIMVNLQSRIVMRTIIIVNLQIRIVIRAIIINCESPDIITFVNIVGLKNGVVKYLSLNQRGGGGRGVTNFSPEVQRAVCC